MSEEKEVTTMKYEYCYVQVQWERPTTFLGGWSLDIHRQAIDEYAEQGWRFAGIVPIDYDSEGKPYMADLVFEREFR